MIGNHAVQMSNRQHSLLREALEEGGMTLERMLSISQITAGSLVQRGWLVWMRGEERFMLTPDALSVMEIFDHTDIDRKTRFRPLSSFVKDRDVLQKAGQRREQLKLDWQADQNRERAKEAGVDRVKEARVKMKTGPTSKTTPARRRITAT